MIPENSQESILVIYDLQDANAWRIAGEYVRCWGRERVVIHNLGAEHVVVEFKPGGDADIRELA